MTYSGLSAALTAAGWTCYKNGAPKGKTEYIVLAPYSVGRLRGDDGDALRWTRCQLDCYSQEADADLETGKFVSILDTLVNLDLPYSVQDLSYDDDAAALRLILQCDIV